MNLSPFQGAPSGIEANQHGDKLDGFSLLFLSRIHEKKGSEYLLEAMPKIQVELGTCNLIIAGDGRPDYIEELKSIAKKDLVFLSMFIGWVMFLVI